MFARKISVDDHPRESGTLGTGIHRLHLPWFRRIQAKELPDSIGAQLFLGTEMPVETAARKAGIGHDLVDRGLGEALPVDQPPCTLNDALASFLLVFGCIG